MAHKFYDLLLKCYVFSCRWRNLKEALLENRSKLGEAQTMQQFSRDVDELEIWISEKLQMAMEESYKDPSNIQVKLEHEIDMDYLNIKTAWSK